MNQKQTRLIDRTRHGYGVQDLSKKERSRLEQTVFDIVYFHHDFGICAEELEIILQLLIIQWIRPGEPGYEVTTTDLAEHLEITERRIVYFLGQLKAKGYITTITQKAYSLAPLLTWIEEVKSNER